jgi:hypothetical protein
MGRFPLRSERLPFEADASEPVCRGRGRVPMSWDRGGSYGPFQNVASVALRESPASQGDRPPKEHSRVGCAGFTSNFFPL